MSTTHIQPLPNGRGRMSYTELGEGKKRTRNIREKTNRIAAQMGDMGTREDFIRFCSAMRRQSQGTRLNEGYELRVSWSPEELSKDSPEDIQRACEYGYALCKEVAPNAPAPEVLPDVPETAETEEQPPADSALDVYDLDRAYVSEMASDLQKAHIHRSREEGKPFMDERYQQIVEARNHPDEQLAKLREDVDAARREFHASKEALDTLQSPYPGLLAGMHVFAKAMQARYARARSASPSAPSSADKDTQFGE